ncbi:MAG: BMP family ABC transporter substrate-binding protein, partial [Clostridia bacterium]|nr:BMP family ABC transporter substrate-binding protein [Clostridia bacterium]
MKKALKVIALVLALAMVVAFAACSGNKGGNNDGTEAANPSDNSSEAPAADADFSNVKVGFIFLHDENSTYDLNFLNAAKEACANLGVEYVLKTNVAETQDCYDTAIDLVDQGCSIIFADSFG